MIGQLIYARLKADAEITNASAFGDRIYAIQIPQQGGRIAQNSLIYRVGELLPINSKSGFEGLMNCDYTITIVLANPDKLDYYTYHIFNLFNNLAPIDAQGPDLQATVCTSVGEQQYFEENQIYAVELSFSARVKNFNQISYE